MMMMMMMMVMMMMMMMMMYMYMYMMGSVPYIFQVLQLLPGHRIFIVIPEHCYIEDRYIGVPLYWSNTERGRR